MKTRRKSDKIEEMGPVNHPNSDRHPAFFNNSNNMPKHLPFPAFHTRRLQYFRSFPVDFML
jgi:hypothetical protein